MDIESISEFFKIEDDPFYRRGYAKGKARSDAKIRMEIAGEMKKDGFPIEQIAKFTKLSVEEIEKL